jgi:hypothetical protein
LTNLWTLVLDGVPIMSSLPGLINLISLEHFELEWLLHTDSIAR